MASRPPLRTMSVASVSSSTDSPTSAGPPGGVPQSITALLNNPLPSAAASSYSWLPWPPPTIALPEVAPTPPSHPCNVTRVDFAPYLAAISDPYARFTNIHLHITAELAASSDVEGAPATSSHLAACLREVPALFFTPCRRRVGKRVPRNSSSAFPLHPLRLPDSSTLPWTTLSRPSCWPPTPFCPRARDELSLLRLCLSILSSLRTSAASEAMAMMLRLQCEKALDTKIFWED